MKALLRDHTGANVSLAKFQSWSNVKYTICTYIVQRYEKVSLKVIFEGFFPSTRTRTRWHEHARASRSLTCLGASAITDKFTKRRKRTPEPDRFLFPRGNSTQKTSIDPISINGLETFSKRA